MIAIASLLLAVAGLGCLSLSMHRHAGQVGLTGAILIARLRPIGWVLLALSLVIRTIAPDWRFGLIEWVGQAALAAGAIVLTLLYAPRLLPQLLKAVAIAAALATTIALVRS